jgi:hypothetical protein
VLGALDDAKVAKNSQIYEDALAELAVTEALLAAEEERERLSRGSAARDRRSTQLIKNLQDEERMLAVLGKERDDLRLRIEAENDVRSAGIELSEAEFEVYVARRKAVRDLTEAQRLLGDAGAQTGDAVGNALERMVVDGERARDVMRNLALELHRMAFRQAVTQNLSRLFEIGGLALGSALFGPSSPYTAGNPTLPPGATYGPDPLLTGGVIPAMGGRGARRVRLPAPGEQDVLVRRGRQVDGGSDRPARARLARAAGRPWRPMVAVAAARS